MISSRGGDVASVVGRSSMFDLKILVEQNLQFDRPRGFVVEECRSSNVYTFLAFQENHSSANLEKLALSSLIVAILLRRVMKTSMEFFLGDVIAGDHSLLSSEANRRYAMKQ